MTYFSKFYQIEVRDEVAREFTNSEGIVDDMMAGLHEIRIRQAEKEYDLERLAQNKRKFETESMLVAEDNENYAKE